MAQFIGCFAEFLLQICAVSSGAIAGVAELEGGYFGGVSHAKHPPKISSLQFLLSCFNGITKLNQRLPFIISSQSARSE